MKVIDARGSVLLLALLVGCASVPVSSLPKLAQLSPREADPGKLEVAVRLPSDFDLPEGAVRLGFTFMHLETEASREGTYHLQPVEDPGGAGLARHRKRGFDIHRFRLAPEDASLIREMRAELAAADGGPGSRSITLSATALPCLKQDANPFQELRLTLFLRPDPSEDYFVLVKETAVPVSGPAQPLRRCG